MTLLNYTIAQADARIFRVSGGARDGGSKFSANVESDGVLGTCSTIDDRIGTYRVACPSVGHNYTLRITLMHVMDGDRVPFTGKMIQEDINVPLFECSIGDGEEAHVRDLPLCADSFRFSPDRVPLWTGVKTLSPQLVFPGVCVIPSNQSWRITGNVFMIGSSHMRLFYDLSVQRMGIHKNNTGVKHEDDSTANLHFFSRHYISRARAPEFQKDEISETLWNISTGHAKFDDIVLIQFGSWDLHGNGYDYTIARIYDTLLPAVDAVRRAGFRVLVMPPPAYPAGAQTGSWAGQRCNPSYAGLVEALRDTLRPEEVFDMSLWTRAFNEVKIPDVDWRCGDHILCYDGNHIIGRFGEATLDALIWATSGVSRTLTPPPHVTHRAGKMHIYDTVIPVGEECTLRKEAGCYGELRIGILTVETTKAPPSAALIVMINELYTRKFGYTFIVERCSMVTSKNYMWEETKHHSISWSKSLFILKHLKFYDFFVFMDADAMFVNHSLSLERFIEQNMPLSASVMVQSDCYDNDPENGCWGSGGAHAPNTGLLVVKNSARGFEVMKEWAAATEDGRCAHQHFVHPRDQMCFNDFIFPKFKDDIFILDSNLTRGLDGTFILHGYESRSPTFFLNKAADSFAYLLYKFNSDIFTQVARFNTKNDTLPWLGHPRREW
jgi:Nucleotide-diphospho-sugar transferase